MSVIIIHKQLQIINCKNLAVAKATAKNLFIKKKAGQINTNFSLPRRRGRAFSASCFALRFMCRSRVLSSLCFRSAPMERSWKSCWRLLSIFLCAFFCSSCYMDGDREYGSWHEGKAEIFWNQQAFHPSLPLSSVLSPFSAVSRFSSPTVPSGWWLHLWNPLLCVPFFLCPRPHLPQSDLPLVH